MLPDRTSVAVWVWRRALRLLFFLDAERAHDLAQRWFPRLMRLPGARRLTAAFFRVEDPRLRVRRFGIDFPNPVGLAAGMDKNADWFDTLQLLGFGFLEVGTLTAKAQPGNPMPRIFRFPADQALVNRMGSPNRGAAAATSHLARQASLPILGVNIGKTASVPNERAADDYRESFECLYPFAGYFTLNVSSPNTVGLRDLQAREALAGILRTLADSNTAQAGRQNKPPRPILVKIAPDLDEQQLDDLLTLCTELRIAGLIVANTTISREGLKTPEKRVHAAGVGGLSGSPLTQRSRTLVATVYRKTRGEIPIVGVGGIMTGEDAWQMIRAGASLIQVYTGFIYNGPGFVASINRHLLRRLSESGKASIEEVIGEAAPSRAQPLQPNPGPAPLISGPL